MTEIQHTNIAVANFIIGELAKDKPFDLVLDVGQTGSLHNIAKHSYHLHSSFADWVEQATKSRVLNGTGIIIRVMPHMADSMYHMLSSYVAKYDLPESVYESLREVS